MTDRAVSDVVGFVLVFALVVSTVGVVTSVGFTSLDDQQEAEQLNNVERAFDVFQNNVENVYRDGAPSRATEMRLAGGTIGYGDPVNVTIRDANNSDVNRSIQTTPLIYSSAGTDIVYEAGAVIRDDGHGSIMLNEPPLYFDSSRAVLPLIATSDSPAPSAISRTGTVRIWSSLKYVNATASTALQDAETKELVVETDRTGAWKRYLDSVRGDVGNVHEKDGYVTMEFETDELSISIFRIVLDYSE